MNWKKYIARTAKKKYHKTIKKNCGTATGLGTSVSCVSTQRIVILRFTLTSSDKVKISFPSTSATIESKRMLLKLAKTDHRASKAFVIKTKIEI